MESISCNARSLMAMLENIVQPAYSPDEYAFSCSADILSISRTGSSAAQPAFVAADLCLGSPLLLPVRTEKLSEESNVTAEVAWIVSCDFFTGDYHVPQRSDLGCSQPKT